MMDRGKAGERGAGRRGSCLPEFIPQNKVGRLLEVIEAVAQQLYCDPQWQEKILEAPEILGIDNISHTGILIRLIIKTQPMQQWSLARELRRRLKKALDEQGIKVGIPQQMMYFSDNFAKSKIYRENN